MQDIKKIQVTAAHMGTQLADIDYNWKEAERHIQTAAEEKSQLIALPEFFTTGFAVNPSLVKAILKQESPLKKMEELAVKYKIAIGGSYLYYEEEQKKVVNKYSLVFPTGEQYHHCKDIPTGLENFCYEAGDTISAFETPLGRIGIAICWEQLRYDTIRRMEQKVDFIIAGSCWWNMCEEDGEAVYQLAPYNAKLAMEAPVTLAEKMGVPVVHASHHAAFEGGTLFDSTKMCVREIVGATQIIDDRGMVLAKKTYEELPQDITATILIADSQRKTSIVSDTEQYWIPQMPEMLIKGFEVLNQKYHVYYQESVLPLFTGNSMVNSKK